MLLFDDISPACNELFESFDMSQFKKYWMLNIDAVMWCIWNIMHCAREPVKALCPVWQNAEPDSKLSDEVKDDWMKKKLDEVNDDVEKIQYPDMMTVAHSNNLRLCVRWLTEKGVKDVESVKYAQMCALAVEKCTDFTLKIAGQSTRCAYAIRLIAKGNPERALAHIPVEAKVTELTEVFLGPCCYIYMKAVYAMWQVVDEECRRIKQLAQPSAEQSTEQSTEADKQSAEAAE